MPFIRESLYCHDEFRTLNRKADAVLLNYLIAEEVYCQYLVPLLIWWMH